MKSLAILLCASTICLVAGLQSSVPAGTDPNDSPISEAKIRALRIPFIENQGQTHPDVAFHAQTFGGAFLVTKKGELLLCLPAGKDQDRRLAVIREVFENAEITRVKGEQRSSTRVSYFIGDDPEKWRADLPTYDRVTLGEIYDGIDVDLRAYGDNVEKIFRVRPGANPNAIRMRVEGTKAIRVTKEGMLALETTHGEVRFGEPVAYQIADGETRRVDAAYRLAEGGYSFRLGDYDKNRDLVIDPLLQSTYLGGDANDRGYAIAVHPFSGHVYVAGHTWSANLPTDPNSAQSAHGNPAGLFAEDAFVAWCRADLRGFHQVTYFGGNGADQPGAGRGGAGGGSALAIHPTSDNIYLTGFTSSTDLPARFGGAIPDGGTNDSFVTCLSPDLTSVVQTTYLTGGLDVRSNALAILQVVPLGPYDVYVTGDTRATNLAGTSVLSYQETHAGGAGAWDAFVARFHDDLQWVRSTYLGGTGDDHGYAIVGHPETREIYVTGTTQSSDFPETTGGWQDQNNGSGDVFVARFHYELGDLPQATYFGGTSTDQALAIAVHPTSGAVYFAGDTSSTDLPGTGGGKQTSLGGGTDGFVARISDELSAASTFQATYLGGSEYDSVSDLDINNSSGDVYAAGTSSTNFPFVGGGAQETPGGGSEAFVTRCGEGLLTGSSFQSTYLGGNSIEFGYGLAINQDAGDVYVTGLTWSTDFPQTTSGAQDTHAGGDQDAYVARFDSSLSGNGGDDGGGRFCFIDTAVR